jgi:hypothetical protein
MPPNRKLHPGGNRTGGRYTICNSAGEIPDIYWRPRPGDHARRTEFLSDLWFRFFIERSHRLGMRSLYDFFFRPSRDRLIRTDLERRVEPSRIDPITLDRIRTISAGAKIDGLLSGRSKRSLPWPGQRIGRYGNRDN